MSDDSLTLTDKTSEDRRSHGPGGARRRVVALVGIQVLIAAAVVFWAVNRDDRPVPLADDWSRLDPQARCARAVTLVRRENTWALVC